MSLNLRIFRYTTACVVIGIGSFLLSASVVVYTYTAGQLVKIPLSIDAATVSTGTAELLDIAALANGKLLVEPTVPITVSQRVSVQDPSNSEVVTLQSAVQMLRDDRSGTAAIVNASIDLLTVDRASGIALADPPGSIQTDMDRPAETVVHEGFQFKFPFATEKKSYPYFDTTLRASYDADFVGESDLEGVRIYQFRQEIEPVAIGSKFTLPASNWGRDGTDPVTMTRFYGITRDLSIEPVSGAIVQVQQHYKQYFGTSVDDPEAITIVDVAPRLDAATQHEQLERAITYRNLIQWGTVYGPLIGVFGGLLLVISGIYLARKASRVDMRIESVDNRKSVELISQ